MIHCYVFDSHDIKRKLESNVVKIIQLTNRKNFHFNRTFNIEFLLINCCYLCRKLLERNKISEEIKSREYLGSLHLRTIKDCYDYVDVEKEFFDNYNIEECDEKKIYVKQVLNFFIHNILFAYNYKTKRVFVTTDQCCKKSCYSFCIETLVYMFKDFYSDEIRSYAWSYTQKGDKKYAMLSRNSSPEKVWSIISIYFKNNYLMYVQLHNGLYMVDMKQISQITSIYQCLLDDGFLKTATIDGEYVIWKNEYGILELHSFNIMQLGTFLDK